MQLTAGRGGIERSTCGGTGETTAELSGDKDAAADALATAHRRSLLVSKPRSLRERMQLTARPEALKNELLVQQRKSTG